MSATDFQSTEVPHYFLTSGRKWLVCIDGSTESKLGLFHALDLMNIQEDNLILVHAAKKSRGLTSRLGHRRPEQAPAPTSGEVGVPEQEPEPDSIKRGKGYLAHAGNLVKQWSDEVKWTSRLIESKDPREAICDLATEEKVDYIVMGSRGQNPIKQLFMGSVSTYVSAHAPCPVIVIRESEEQKREKKAASVEEKKVQKKTGAEKKRRWLSWKKGEGEVKSETVLRGEEGAVGTAEKLPEPPIVPPVNTLNAQGPIVPNETTIPVMEK